MKLRNAWVMALALFGTTAAYAVEDDSTNWYFGLSAASFDFEQKGAGGSSFNTYGGIARLGYDLGNYLSVEGRMGFGGKDDDGTYRVEPARVAAAYVRLNLPIDKVKIYLLGGYGAVTAKVDLMGVDTSHDELTGASYGGGIELYGNRTTALTLEYVRYVEEQNYEDAAIGVDADFDVNSLSIGFVHHF